MNRFVKALEAKYQAEIEESLALIDLYLNKAVGVGEHPDILPILDDNIAKLENNKSKLATLKSLFTPVDGDTPPQSDNKFKNMSKLSKKDKEELEYLEIRNDVRDFVDKIGYDSILRYMIEQLDNIEDITNTQSIELFKLISNLESALQSHQRLQEYV